MAVERYHPPELQAAAHSELVESAPSNRVIGISIVGAVGAVFTVIGVAGGPGFFTILGLVMLAAVAVGFWLMQRESSAWHDAEIYFDEWPLHLGGSNRIAVVRASKKPFPDAARFDLNAVLTCTEWVEWQVGTDTRTERAKVVEIPLTIPGSVQTNTFVGKFDLEIPVDEGGPTLDLKHNKVSWELDIDLEPLSTFSFHKDIALTVFAALDPSQAQYVDAPPPPGPQDA